MPACSKQGKGLFTTGVTGMTFVTLDKLIGAKRAREIHDDAAAAVDELEQAGAPDALIEQYKIQLGRLEPQSPNGSPGNEVMNFPGYMPGGGPSTCDCHTRRQNEELTNRFNRPCGGGKEVYFHPPGSQPLLLQGNDCEALQTRICVADLTLHIGVARRFEGPQ